MKAEVNSDITALPFGVPSYIRNWYNTPSIKRKMVRKDPFWENIFFNILTHEAMKPVYNSMKGYNLDYDYYGDRRRGGKAPLLIALIYELKIALSQYRPLHLKVFADYDKMLESTRKAIEHMQEIESYPDVEIHIKKSISDLESIAEEIKEKKGCIDALRRKDSAGAMLETGADYDEDGNITSFYSGRKVDLPNYDKFFISREMRTNQIGLAVYLMRKLFFFVYLTTGRCFYNQIAIIVNLLCNTSYTKDNVKTNVMQLKKAMG